MNPGVDLAKMQYPLINVQDVKGTGSNIIYQIGPLQYIPTSGFYDYPIKTDRRPEHIGRPIIVNTNLPNGGQIYQMATQYSGNPDGTSFSMPMQYPPNFIPNQSSNYIETPMAVPIAANYGQASQDHFIDQENTTPQSYIPTEIAVSQAGSYLGNSNYIGSGLQIQQVHQVPDLPTYMRPMEMSNYDSENSVSYIDNTQSAIEDRNYMENSQLEVPSHGLGNYVESSDGMLEHQSFVGNDPDMTNFCSPNLDTTYTQNGIQMSENDFNSYLQSNIADESEYVEKYGEETSLRIGNPNERDVEGLVQAPEDVMGHYQIKREPPEQDEQDDSVENILPHTKQSKQYKCEICRKKFVYIRNLAKHMNKHEKEEPMKKVKMYEIKDEFPEQLNHYQQPKTKLYKCKDCNEVFEQASRLKRHEYEHTNEKPFICKYCDMTFAQASNLIQHVQLNHDNI